MRSAIFLAALLFAVPAAAAETTITVTQAAPPASYKPEGREIDLVGIVPGMTADQVRPILVQRFGNAIKEETSALGLNYRGVAVQSQHFLASMVASKEGDLIAVRFGTPATGNAVVEISRQLVYADGASAPLIESVRESLAKQYGPPSAQSTPVFNGELSLQDWAYKDNKQIRCPNASCRISGAEGMNGANLESYRRAVALGRQLLISATILASTSDPKRAGTVWVVVSDMQTKLRTFEEGLKQVQAAAVAESRRVGAADAPETEPAPARPARRR